jgi:hypothetical protein
VHYAALRVPSAEAAAVLPAKKEAAMLQQQQHIIIIININNNNNNRASEQQLLPPPPQHISSSSSGSGTNRRENVARYGARLPQGAHCDSRRGAAAKTCAPLCAEKAIEATVPAVGALRPASPPPPP